MITYVRPDKDSIKVFLKIYLHITTVFNKETTNYFSHCTSCPCNSLLFPRASSVTLVTLSQNSTTFFLSKPCLCSSAKDNPKINIKKKSHWVKEGHRSYRRNFCSCEKEAWNFLFAIAKVASITAMIFFHIIFTPQFTNMIFIYS